MEGEESYIRFVLIVMAFVFSMVILIFMGCFLGAFIGWDGLGVTSFLLVVYYKNRKSLGSGIITALTNRLGDCFFFFIAWFVILFIFVFVFFSFFSLNSIYNQKGSNSIFFLTSFSYSRSNTC